MTIAVDVMTYQRIALLRDSWNEHFYDGKKYLGINTVIRLLLAHYQYADDEGKVATFQDFDDWLAAIPQRGRPKMKFPKPRSRPPNPLDMDVMMDRGG